MQKKEISWGLGPCFSFFILQIRPSVDGLMGSQQDFVPFGLATCELIF